MSKADVLASGTGTGSGSGTPDVVLSLDQKRAFSLYERLSNIFLTGAGGSGKSHLVRHIVADAKTRGINVQVCAMTGCAAVLLKCGASTLHSWSGIRLARGSKADIVRSVVENTYSRKNWRSVQLLIIDEVSMMSQKIFEIIEEIARICRGSRMPFGGIQVIFVGDFYQLPPVGDGIDPTTSNFCFESPIWPTVFKPEEHVSLATIHRQTDQKYIDILLKIRRGCLDEDSERVLIRQLDRPITTEIAPTRLFPTRAKADNLNFTKYNELTTPEYNFEIIKRTNLTTYEESGKPIPLGIINKCRNLSAQQVEYEVNYLVDSLQLQPVLGLKVGAVVMCTVNLDIGQGICNGSQGVIVEIIDDNTSGTGTMGSGASRVPGVASAPVPVVKFVNGQTIPIGRHFWQSEHYPCIGVSQIPLKLAWALTIHKCQGSTLDLAQMDIGSSVFECGQTYVALSRVKSLAGLYLTHFNPKKIKVNTKVHDFYTNMSCH